MSIRTVAATVAGLMLALPALAHAEVTVALLPIGVHATGSDSEYLKTGLESMISARLEQYEGLTVVRTGDATAPVTGRDEALSRGRDLGADFVLYGSFTRFGEGASLDLRCAAVEEAVAEDGEDDADASPDASRQVFIQAGTLAQIIPDLDTLAQKVARFTLSAPTTPPLRGQVARGTAGNGAPTAAQYQELLRRLDALERATFTPVAQGEPPPPQGAEAVDGDAAPSVVR